MKPYLMQTLKEIALLGAIKNKIEISSQDLAKQLAISQQTASRYLLDLDTVEYCYLQGRDTKLVKNIQANDEDKVKHKFLTECGLKRINFEKNAYITNYA